MMMHIFITICCAYDGFTMRALRPMGGNALKNLLNKRDGHCSDNNYEN